MPSTLALKGLYIDSLSKSLTDTSMYTNLLGTDGLGQNPNGGNKIDNLITYMVTQGYNYAIFSGLNNSDFVASPSDEQFLPTAVNSLKTIIEKFSNNSITVSAEIDLAILNRANSRFDGTSQIRKIVDYNSQVSNASIRKFKWVTVNTPFWNFQYDTTNTYIAGQKLQVTNNGLRLENLWGSSSTVNSCGNTVTPDVPLSANIDVHDYIKVNWFGTTRYREVVNKTVVNGKVVAVDLDADIQFTNTTCLDFTIVQAQSAPEYGSFKARLDACRTYYTSVVTATPSATLNIEVIADKPNYTYGGAVQLRFLYPSADRIILTNYDRVPNWNAVETGLPYDTNSAGVKKRVTEDILPTATTVKNIGFIISAESPTLNRDACDKLLYNYSGYFIEGRTLQLHTATTLTNIFRPTNGTNEVLNPAYCNYACCASNTIFKPAGSTYSTRNLQAIWNYTVGTPPTAGSTNPPEFSATFDEQVASGAIASALATKAVIDTEIVYSQSIVRQLNPSGSFYFTSYPGSSDCYNISPGTGKIRLDFYNGTAPYSISWSGPTSGTATTSNASYTIGSLINGTYNVTVNGVTNTGIIVSNSSEFSVGGSGTVPYIISVSPNPYCPKNTSIFTLSGPPTGGVAPYTFYVESITVGLSYRSSTVTFVPGQLSSDYYGITVPNPTSGTYNYVVRWNDSLGCGHNMFNAFTTSPSTVNIAAGQIISPTCGGGSTGSLNNITAFVNGSPINFGVGNTLGSPSGVILNLKNTALGINRNIPYDTITANNDFLNLPAATYTVTLLLGTKGCEIAGSIQIPDTTALSVTINSPVGANCWYSTTGSLTTTVSGGTAPYTYLWSNGATTSGISNLSPGTYSVRVVDANNCGVTTSYSLSTSNLSPINYTYRIEEALVGEKGSIYIDSISGSISPYTYLWKDSNNLTVGTSQDLVNVVPGDYTLTVTSNLGCIKTQTFKLGYKCPDFNLAELKTTIYKIECCAGNLAKEYVRYQNVGRGDLAKCKLLDLKYLTLVLDALCKIESLIDPKLSCEDISNILNQVNKICDCDCCRSGTQKYNVKYNLTTGQLDATKAIN